MRKILLLCAFLLLLGACAGDVALDGVSSSDGFDVTVAADGFAGPTQIAHTDNGLLVAEIAGRENDVSGQVSRLYWDDPSVRPLLYLGLDKPTGVALIDGDVWIMEAESLSFGPLAGSAPRTMIAENLPSNGRSQGTLTVTADGKLLFNTSGSKRGAEVADGSGRLFEVDPAIGVIDEVAKGFKHAYAHTFGADGELWVTEMTDGRFDGDPAPDEVVAIVRGADHGWPHCVGDNRPVAEFGGSESRCDTVPGSLATFEPGATPTSLVVAPWDANVLLVALWNRGQVVQVRVDGHSTQEPEVLVSGLQNPQHLLVDVDEPGSVLLTEFGTGRILRIRRSD